MKHLLDEKLIKSFSSHHSKKRKQLKLEFRNITDFMSSGKVFLKLPILADDNNWHWEDDEQGV